MTKVVYSVVKEGRNGSSKMTGLGYLTEKDLIIACISKNSKPYIRVFEDCVKNCHLVHNTKDEYKGTYYEIKEIEFEVKNSSGQTVSRKEKSKSITVSGIKS